MKKHLLIIFFFAIGLANAQKTETPRTDRPQRSSGKLDPSIGEERQPEIKVSIKDYKLISHQGDTTYVDTSQTLQKEYKFNYLRKDNFELLSFSNIGQTYNRLGVDFNKVSQYPEIGIRSKHFNYQEVEDITYFEVPTITSDLMYKSAFEQGQLLDALIAFNTSRQTNIFIGFKGLRSLGKYQNILSSTGNFKLGGSYNSKNKRYRLRAHMAVQDITNQENGGLTEQSVTNFLSGEEEFTDRSRLEVNFEDAVGLFEGKRYYLDHSYVLHLKKDSTSYSAIRIGHTFNYNTKFYQYDQTAASSYFAESFNSRISDRAQLRSMYNELRASYDTKLFGNLTFKANNYGYNYFFTDVLIRNGQVQPNKIEGSDIGIGGSWKHKIAGVGLEADIVSTIVGDLGGNYFAASARYAFSEDLMVQAGIASSTKSPNFNFQLYQSDYGNYNWVNSFKKEKVQNINFQLKSNKWFNASASYSVLDDHAYFTETSQSNVDTLLVAPAQFSGTINHLKVKVQREFKFGRFALDNTIMYQDVSQSQEVLNIPQLVTRNTLYYTDKLFKKALFLQTGVTFNYFTKYKANGYNPLLGEFYSQNTTEIGGFPRLDFFVNAKVRRTRIFLKAEHFNSSLTGSDFFSAPNYPYRDFTVRFGVVWNFLN